MLRSLRTYNNKLILNFPEPQTIMIGQTTHKFSHNFFALQPEQYQENPFDFSNCSRLKKLTTHDIYRFSSGNVQLIVKLFASQALQNYKQEVDILSRLSLHPQFLPLKYYRTAENTNSCLPLVRSHVIVTKEATRGDLNDYLPRFGKMNEKMARTYFLQLISALSYGGSLEKPIIHPNLQPSSILLGESGELYICGWSELSQTEGRSRLEDCIFSCGEILMCMLTSFMPFYKRYTVTDAFYKFISEEHINKFWEQTLKGMRRKDKIFQFGESLKQLLSAVFLKKVKSFQELKNHEWMKGEIYTPIELLQVIVENERIKMQKEAIRIKQEQENIEKRKKLLVEFQLSIGLQRSSQFENIKFLEDYQQFAIIEEELPFGRTKLKALGSPGFIAACLKYSLDSEAGKSTLLSCQQIILRNHKIVKASNYLLVILHFQISLIEEQEETFVNPEPTDYVTVKIQLNFYRHQKQLYVQCVEIESSFNSYYTNLLIGFLQHQISNLEENSQPILTKNEESQA